MESLGEDMVRRGSKLGIATVVGSLLLAGGVMANRCRDAPEEYSGFPRLDEGTHEVSSYFIPTSGDVVSIWKDPSFEYEEVQVGDCVRISGDFSYRIRAGTGNLPLDADSSMLRDVRGGYVTLCPPRG